MQVLLALPHTHVMLRYCRFFLHFHTHVMLRYCTFLLHLRTHVMLHYTNAGSSCTSTHKNVMLRYCRFFLHLHTRHSTLLQVLLALPHTRHATLLQVLLALAHTRHATLLQVFLALAHSRHATLGVGWGGEGGLITFKYTSTHTSCYATAPSLGRNTYTSSSTDITRSTRPPTLLWMKNKFCVLLQFGTLNDDTHKTL